MNSQVFTAKIRRQNLSTGELAGLSITGILTSILIISAVFLNWGAPFLLWQIPNLIFATVVVGATYVLIRRGQPLTFKRAFIITVVGIAVTGVVAVIEIGLMFGLSFDMVMNASFVPRHYATYVIPGVIMFLLGAAQTSRQLLVSCFLLVVILLALIVPVSGPWRQLIWSVIYCINLLLGFPLAVLGRQYSNIIG